MILYMYVCLCACIIVMVCVCVFAKTYPIMPTPDLCVCVNVIKDTDLEESLSSTQFQPQRKDTLES